MSIHCGPMRACFAFVATMFGIAQGQIAAIDSQQCYVDCPDFDTAARNMDNDGGSPELNRPDFSEGVDPPCEGGTDFWCLTMKAWYSSGCTVDCGGEASAEIQRDFECCDVWMISSTISSAAISIAATPDATDDATGLPTPAWLVIVFCISIISRGGLPDLRRSGDVGLQRVYLPLLGHTESLKQAHPGRQRALNNWCWWWFGRPAVPHAGASERGSEGHVLAREGCFLPGTMVWTSNSEAKKVEAITFGDSVLGVSGAVAHIMAQRIHACIRREVVELKTRAAFLKVTSDHRIVVPDGAGGRSSEKLAGELRTGDRVFVGQEVATLVRVTPQEMVTAVIELRLEPDIPIEAFLAPRWGLVSLGQARDEDIDSLPSTEDGF